MLILKIVEKMIFLQKIFRFLLQGKCLYCLPGPAGCASPGNSLRVDLSTQFYRFEVYREYEILLFFVEIPDFGKVSPYNLVRDGVFAGLCGSKDFTNTLRAVELETPP